MENKKGRKQNIERFSDEEVLAMILRGDTMNNLLYLKCIPVTQYKRVRKDNASIIPKRVTAWGDSTHKVRNI